MGAACCVASKEKDKTTQSGSPSEILHRNIRCSPTWSFRWDHRRRVAGEDTSTHWLSDGISQNDGTEDKTDSANKSEDGIQLQNNQRHGEQKSPICEGTAGHARTYAPDTKIMENEKDSGWKRIKSVYPDMYLVVFSKTEDQSNSRNVSMDVSMEQGKASEESPIVSCSHPSKPSFPMPSTSFQVSPISSQSHFPPASSTLPRCPCHSPGNQLLQQVSPGRIPGLKSPSSLSASEERSVLPSWGNESGRFSRAGSSDGWSIPGFSELMGTSYGGRWSFDSESFCFDDEKLPTSSSQISNSPVDLHTCGVCSKLLTERSSWSTQKIIASNELSVVAVLICGHVYHAECLESLTPEINKYDPTCPVCTFGEKQTLKMSEKALNAKMDLKAKNKKSMNRVVDSGTDDDSCVFDDLKGRGNQGKGLHFRSSGRNTFGKPFLRHFSFGSRSSKTKSFSNHPARKKGFFRAKSNKD
ncbi:43kDa postsynaptic protein [Senna tora]|uniref:43kDa postsynaptic protein n=1 Tax=Senna tora TaxID=362788 RepID=A0A834SZD0_9FABA|nr:43kDa postsynaptic protein [Senna tora]